MNYAVIPSHGLRIAQMAYDSDELPSKWVHILNHRFDLALFTSPHLEHVAATSGVRIPLGTLPVGLDLAAALARSGSRSTDRTTIRFGSLAAWHDRKDNFALLDAFLDEFGDDTDVELILHSNLIIGDTYDRIARHLARRNARNVLISHEHLSLEEKDALLDSIDILASCSRGEGYSIAPREALARGCVLVLSDIGAHQDLLGVPGVFAIPPVGYMPARYPEIDHQIFGRQITMDRVSIRSALRQAYDYLLGQRDDDGVHLRKARASEFSFDALASSYAEIINPQIRQFRTRAGASRSVRLPELGHDPGRLGRHARGLAARNWVVVPAHDAGFFSLFNTYVSHLVWDSLEDRCHMVIPDWDVSRLQKRYGSAPLESFCYGTPRDGNIWCHLFQPPFGLSIEDMNDVNLFERKGVGPETVFNDHREPLLTYVNAYDLYHSPWFRQFRHQYHRTIASHVRLLPHFADEIDAFTAAFDGRLMIAAHVKHPSHVIEQPGGALAVTATYIERVRQEVTRRGLDASSREWGVFLATDQDAVVSEFELCFGDRLHVFRDVRRTSPEDDARYQRLPPADQARAGHQVQHLVASSPENWSVRLAWEVVRDALAISRCNIFLHVVSNVATAASYFNPDLEMIFCHPDHSSALSSAGALDVLTEPLVRRSQTSLEVISGRESELRQP